MKQVRTFQGQVNDKVFDNQKSMNKYIAECVENGVDITYTSSNTSVRYVTDEEAEKMNLIERENCENCEGCEKCKNHEDHTSEPRRFIIESIPDPYKTIEEYLVPYFNEKCFTSNVAANMAQIKDSSIKIQRRLSYINNNYETIIAADLGEQIAQKLANKYRWCNKRTQETDSIINNNNERIKRLQAEIQHLEESNTQNAAINKSYFDLGTYCEVAFNKLTGRSLINDGTQE